MIPAPFKYAVADSVDHAIDLLRGAGGEAKLLAGGHSLLPLMRLRLARPDALVDLGRLSELSYVRDAGEKLAIGALTRHHDLARDPLLGEHCRLVSMAAREIGDPQVRHCGTIGGSVVHGDPASDLPAVLLALDAEFVVRGHIDDRVIAARDFFQGLFMTHLGPYDVLTEIRVPKLDAFSGCGFVKFARRAQDWATVGVAAVVTRDDGHIGSAAVGLVNMGQTPLRATAVEDALRGAEPAAIGAAAEHADEGTTPTADTAASAEFRRHLARVLVRRALEEAMDD